MVQHLLLHGDVFDALKTLAAQSVQGIVTSPPYFQQRIYGVEGEIGTEKSADEYVDTIGEVGRELYRVLRDDGTFWLNIGDTYKNKELVGIPWLCAFELKRCGWILRNEAIWNKRAYKPEGGLKDRLSRNHEQVFLFTKTKKGYYFDQEGIREPDDLEKGILRKNLDQFQRRGRLRRTVWNISSVSSRTSHTATFPLDLVELCVAASTSDYGCCLTCGAPFARQIEKGEIDLEWQRSCGGDRTGKYTGKALKDYAKAGAEDASSIKARILQGMRKQRTVGWMPRCECVSNEVVPCTVLDPFMGVGTAARVAYAGGRSSIGIELNPESVADYQKEAQKVGMQYVVRGV